MAHSGEPAIETVDVEGIREYLTQSSVEFAILFGSHAQGTASDTSDVDIAIRFPEELTDYERFSLRNRIDADLQEYAAGFVDVSDIETLPNPVAYAALQDGIRLVGDSQTIDTYQGQINREYETAASERKQERREFIDRLARGDV
ncbi:type VII toxin-antitoxin system MntA family adenylyltransferase antitoxin [Halalkalicoccus salilacus]|uniref:type VII toxin-antitoxin system MntA family adenylyltransferase antitoxin n=1 Tax=Halalkalicoccus salilacus TaxID=3117459 RepID=UPI00300E9E77